MIWESQYWKEDLVRLARRIRKRGTQKRWPENSLAKLEKELFIGCYSVRKLLEAKKLSDRIANGKVLAHSFNAIGSKRVTILNWGTKFIEAYDFSKPKRVRLPILFLCNQMIHSYVYIPVLDKSGMLSGIYINSDHERHKRVYYLPLSIFVRLFSNVGGDYPSHSRAIFDQSRGEYLIKNW